MFELRCKWLFNISSLNQEGFLLKFLAATFDLLRLGEDIRLQTLPYASLYIHNMQTKSVFYSVTKCSRFFVLTY